MTHRIVWRERASADLDAIYDWIADGADPEIALRFVTRIEAACERLADFPFSGRSRDDIGPGLRSIPFAGTVTVFYMADEEAVSLVRVVDARRDTAAAFEEE